MKTRIVAAAILLTAIASQAMAVDVTFNWPFEAGTGGYYQLYEEPGGPWLMDRYRDTITLALNDGIYSVAGAGWNMDNVQIEVTGGAASLVKNDDNIGLVDNGDNTFTFVAATLAVQLEVPGFWQPRAAGYDRIKTSGSVDIVYGPSYTMDGEGFNFPFGIAADGTVTLGESTPSTITASGNTITISGTQVTFNWDENTAGFYELGGSGRLRETSTVTLTDGVYNVGGDGWHFGSLVITVADGVASMTANEENVGIVDNGDNSFTFQTVTYNVVTERETYWEAYGTGRITGDGTVTTVIGPYHTFHADANFHFGIDAAGVITLGDDEPGYIRLEDGDNTMRIVSDTTQIILTWPADTLGYFETQGTGGRVSSDQILNVEDGIISVDGGGWSHGTLQIEANAGAATIISNSENVGIEEYTGNLFIFQAASFDVICDSACYWETEGSGRTVGNDTLTVIIAPNHRMGGASTMNFHYGVGPDGTVTLADDAPSYVSAEGSTITIDSQEFTISPSGIANEWQVGSVGTNGGINGWPTERLTEEQALKLWPGTYRIVVYGAEQEQQDFTINEDWTVSNGSFSIGGGSFNITAAGQPTPTWPVEGDANLDCKVNIIDLIFVRNRLNGDVASDDNWQADVNSDGKVNIIDLIYVRNRLNSKCDTLPQ